MKNFTGIVAMAALAAATLIPACKSAPVATTFEAIENTHHLQTTTGGFEVSYRFEYLSSYSDPAVLQKVQLAMASDIFGSEFSVTDAGASAAAFDASVQHNYGIRADSSSFHWDGYLHLKSTAYMVGNHIVSYTVTRSEDTGGAHVMDESHLSNYDLRTGGRLTLDDLFTPEGKAALAEAIRARILQDKGVATWEALMARDCFNPAIEVTPTENFALSATDITFVYNPYDIACHAAGSTKAVLPLANLAGFKKEIFGN